MALSFVDHENAVKTVLVVESGMSNIGKVSAASKGFVRLLYW